MALETLAAVDATGIQVAGTPAGASGQRSGTDLSMLVVTNPNAAVKWVQIFDQLKADVTLGTTQAELEFRVAANDTLSLAHSLPLVFTRGLTVYATDARNGSALTGTALTVALDVSRT